MENAVIESFTIVQLLKFFGPRILMGLLCGGIVGLERELKHKAAGIKTNMLICTGAVLFTSLSMLMSQANSSFNYYGDPARLAAQIVSGIGFLGGGAIIQSRGTVVGLTTAATIWVVAAIGVAIGLGHGIAALGVTGIVVASLVSVSTFEDRFLGRNFNFVCEILAIDPEGGVRKVIYEALERHDLILEDFDSVAKGKNTTIRIKYRGHRNDHKKFILSLWTTPGIQEVKQS